MEQLNTNRIVLRAALVVALVMAAPVRGHAKEITTDTTWTAAQSPVALSEATSVAKGVKLTIEPGVTVRLAAGVSLTINGQLIARGTSAKPIVFTGAKLTSGTARWGSILFTDSAVDASYSGLERKYSAGSALEHCTVEYGSRAVYLRGASPLIKACSFSNNYIKGGTDKRGGAALMIIDGASPLVQGNTFKDNEANAAEGGAVYLDGGDAVFQDNRFEGNKSAYGGALTTYNHYAPIVGNSFSTNNATLEGGAMALVSSSQALLNNVVKDNSTTLEGGGIHVCLDCNPHAVPLVMDNTITGNINTLHTGAAGIGAAFLRVFAHNNIHGNTRPGWGPSDFGWLQDVTATDPAKMEPAWAQNINIAHNWWGTTDEKKIAESITDGADEKKYGKVTFTPVRTSAVAKASTRVTITTRRLIYKAKAEAMPVFLTLYNPGAARTVDLVLLLQYGSGPPVPYGGAAPFAGASQVNGAYRIKLPANSVLYTRLIKPTFPGVAKVVSGQWSAALFDAASGSRIGDTCSIHFQLGQGGGS